MSADDYRRTLEALYRLRRRGVKPGLDRMRRALEVVAPSSPPALQIGGTNGKGSTAAYCAALLEGAGLRVGLFSSPHLLRLGERFVIDGREASRDDLVSAYRATAVRATAELTFFERITCMAMWLFARDSADVCVLEVGLGGRLDATTAAEAIGCAVTGVDLDHCEWLGDTVEDIAFEKAGIFRPGVPAVIGAAGDPAGVAFLRGHADRAGSAPVVTVDATGEDARTRPHGSAARALVAAVAADLGLADTAADAPVATLVSKTPLGRAERVDGDPVVWLDGAHNPAATRHLVSRVEAVDEVDEIVLAVMADKDAAGMVRALAPLCSRFRVTQVASDRALSVAELEAVVRAEAPEARVARADSVAAALAAARADCRGGTVVVTGSLYAVGEARAALFGDERDPFVVSDPLRKPAQV